MMLQISEAWKTKDFTLFPDSDKWQTYLKGSMENVVRYDSAKVFNSYFICLTIFLSCLSMLNEVKVAVTVTDSI